MTISFVLKLALPIPLRATFEYKPPLSMDEQSISALRPGMRFKVAFGHQILVGILVELGQPEYDANKIKPAIELLDSNNLIPNDTFNLVQWASKYYSTPIGEAFFAAIPKILRNPDSVSIQTDSYWSLSTEGKGLPCGSLKRSKKQQALHTQLLECASMSTSQIKEAKLADALKKLIEKQLVIEIEKPPQALSLPAINTLFKEQAPVLNNEQSIAVNAIKYDKFSTYLLDGTTGSGKTEVYLHAIARVLQAGKQALLLVPEIGLTPQTVLRVRQRFNSHTAELHSNVSDKQRWLNWHASGSGEAQIIIGTRLSVFTPFKNLGIIIIDEEHDLSFKQQDGMRYSARDLAIVRSQKLGIPLILGSATPSIETINNSQKQRYQHLSLTQRAGNAVPPTVELIDMRKQNQSSGLAQSSFDAIEATLARGEQVLIFLNRRGYAPALICPSCGWSISCKRCDAQMTLHRSPPHLRCHHCNTRRPVPTTCGSCHNPQLNAYGHGTERFEESLQHHYPSTDVIRVDRDSMSRKKAMKELTDKLGLGQPCILVGTQMLAKGHHFPKVTLVIIVDADSGLLSGDFRGTERAAQLITQVSGRAGRAESAGHVLLQSYKPEHPFFRVLLQQGYHQLALDILHNRMDSQLPPHWFMCLVHAESKRAEIATEFLLMVKSQAQSLLNNHEDHHFLGPIPALMERREDRLRFQLQIKFVHRPALQKLLSILIPMVEQHALAKRCRWAIDVDPLEMG